MNSTFGILLDLPQGHELRKNLEETRAKYQNILEGF